MMPIHDGSRVDEGSSVKDDHFNERATVLEYWWRVPKRYVLALMAFTGVFIFDYIRWNYIGFIQYVYTYDEFTEEHYPHIKNWTASEVNNMVSSTEWGNIVGQIPGALLVIHFSAHKIMTISGVLSSLLHIVMPLTFYHNTAVIIIINFLRGIALAPLQLAFFRIWGFWASPKERTRFIVITFCGGFLARYIYTHPIFFLLKNYGSFVAFLIAGIIGILWCLLWYFVIYDTPRSHPKITQSELVHLEQSIRTDTMYKATVKSIPIRALFTSFPVLSFLFAYVTFVFAIIVAEFAPVMDYIVYGANEMYDLIENFNFPVYLFVSLFIISGFKYDLLISKNFNPTKVRKAMCTGGMVLSGIAFACTFIPVVYVYSFTLALICMGISTAGIFANVLDLSPGYGSLLLAVAEILSSSILLIYTKIIHMILDSSDNYWNWTVVKGAASALLIFSGIVFADFGSAEEQACEEQQEPHHVPGSNYHTRENTDRDDLELITESL